MLTCVCVFQPQPLAFLEEDIREVLKQETGADIFHRADVLPDYSRAWKLNVRLAHTHTHTAEELCPQMVLELSQPNMDIRYQSNIIQKNEYWIISGCI